MEEFTERFYGRIMNQIVQIKEKFNLFKIVD